MISESLQSIDWKALLIWGEYRARHFHWRHGYIRDLDDYRDAAQEAFVILIERYNSLIGDPESFYKAIASNRMRNLAKLSGMIFDPHWLTSCAYRRGEENSQTKLTEAKVREILKAKGSISVRKMASKAGISKSQVQNIWSGKNWAWLS